MEALREYLLRMCAAGVLCALVSGLLGKKGMIGAATKLLTGMLMLVTLLSPLVKLPLTSLDSVLTDITQEADSVAASGENSARQAMEAIIMEKTEAYILDKAKGYGGSITVSVTLNGESLPAAVQISGSISPYGKKQLQDSIEQELGIPMEAQTWN